MSLPNGRPIIFEDCWRFNVKQGLKGIMAVLVIILQGNIFVELRTNLYLCRRRLISWGEYGKKKRNKK